MKEINDLNCITFHFIKQHMNNLLNVNIVHIIYLIHKLKYYTVRTNDNLP